MEIPTPLGADDYFGELEVRLKKASSLRQLADKVVTEPFFDPRIPTYMGMGIIGLFLVNKDERMIDSVAFTRNEMTRGIFRMSNRPLDKVKIPLDYPNNFIAKAIRENHYMITADWEYLLNPAVPAEQAHFIQAGGGIACSVIYPLANITNKGALVFSFYETIQRIGHEHHNFMARYATLVQRLYRNLEGMQTSI